MVSHAFGIWKNAHNFVCAISYMAFNAIHMYRASTFVLLFLGSVSCCPGFGQSLHPQGLFSSIQVSASPRLAYTVGELAVLQFPPQGGPSLQHGYLASVIAPLTVTSVSSIPGWGDVFQLYPNPVGDWLTLKRSGETGASLTVLLMEAQGRVIQSEVVQDGQRELVFLIAQIPSGLYFLTITHSSGVHLHTFQIVKP
jgi:hypothetical protein